MASCLHIVLHAMHKSTGLSNVLQVSCPKWALRIGKPVLIHMIACSFHHTKAVLPIENEFSSSNSNEKSNNMTPR